MGVIDEGVSRPKATWKRSAGRSPGARVGCGWPTATWTEPRPLSAHPEVAEASVERQHLDFVLAGDDDTSAGLLSELVAPG